MRDTLHRPEEPVLPNSLDEVLDEEYDLDFQVIYMFLKNIKHPIQSSYRLVNRIINCSKNQSFFGNFSSYMKY